MRFIYIIIVLLALISSKAIAYSTSFNEGYIGMNLGYRDGGYKQNFGNNIFKQNHPVIEFYVGARFWRNWFLEVGYDTTFIEKQQRSINANTSILNARQANYGINKTTSRVSSWNLGIIGDWYMLDKVSLLTKASIKSAKAKVSREVIPGENKVGFRSRKIIPKVTGGFEHRFNESIAGRFLVSWANDARLKPETIRVTGEKWQSRLQNALVYSIGFMVRFA